MRFLVSKFIVLLPVLATMLTLSAFGQQQDHYKILGVDSLATTVQIKSAFRQKARETHPDLVQDPQEKKLREEKFKQVNEANEVLSDPQKRATFNRTRAHEPSRSNFQASELIVLSLVKHSGRPMDEMIKEALSIMDSVLPKPETLRPLYTNANSNDFQFIRIASVINDIFTRTAMWTQYNKNHDDVGEAVLKASFLWLKKIKWKAPNVYNQIYLAGYKYNYEQFLQSKTGPQGESHPIAQLYARVLNFANEYAVKDWNPPSSASTCHRGF